MVTEIDFPRPRNPVIEAYNLMTAPINGVPCRLLLTFADSPGISIFYSKSAAGIDVTVIRSDREKGGVQGSGVIEITLDSRLSSARILPLVIETEHEKKTLGNIDQLRRKSQRFLDQSRGFQTPPIPFLP